MMRRMKALRALVVCCGLLGMTQSASVSAFPGNNILEYCTEKTANDYSEAMYFGVCIGYIQGVIEGQDAARLVRGQPKPSRDRSASPRR